MNKIDLPESALVRDPGIEQPKLRQGNNLQLTGHVRVGGIKAQRRLSQLKFDPIEELVKKYRKIEEELDYLTQWRDGKIQPVYVTIKGEVRNRNFRHEDLMATYDRLTNIGKELLRYGYGRVPEISDAVSPPPPVMLIQTTGKNEVYIAPEASAVDESDFEDD